MEAEFIYLGVPIAAVIVGLVQVIKKSVNPPEKYVPLISILLGLVSGIIASLFSGYDMKYIFMGLVSGLSACGLFDFGKKSVSK